jgi:hypothetical protein
MQNIYNESVLLGILEAYYPVNWLKLNESDKKIYNNITRKIQKTALFGQKRT